MGLGRIEREESSERELALDCMDCKWSGLISEADFDYDWDEFKQIENKFPICPLCSGGLEY